MGEDVSERLDVVPAKFRVIVTRRPKYAFKNADGVIQAPAPALSSKEAFRRKRFWPRSPSPKIPTVHGTAECTEHIAQLSKNTSTALSACEERPLGWERFVRVT